MTERVSSTGTCLLPSIRPYVFSWLIFQEMVLLRNAQGFSDLGVRWNLWACLLVHKLLRPSGEFPLQKSGVGLRICLHDRFPRDADVPDWVTSKY